jgi:hypothetical protein
MQANGGDSALDHAAKRLEAALAMLQQRLTLRVAEAGAGANGAMDQDRAKLASELDAARARERELKAAGEEASMALGQAIAEIRAALSGPTAGEGA